MLNHTPGPWKVEQHEHEPDFYTIRTSPGNQYVALVDGLDMGTAKGGQLAANARLIAAAPALLEALECVSVMLNTELRRYETEPWAVRARAAIRQAKGESA